MLAVLERATQWTVNWGDVPTWIQAVASLLALAGAAVAVTQSWRVLQIERERDEIDRSRDRAEAERELSTQARFVSAWVRPEGDRLVMLVANRSELPVYSAVVVLEVGGRGPLVVVDGMTIPPANDPQRFEPLIEWGPSRVTMRFTDSAGMRWVRADSGLLSRESQ